MNLFSIDLTHGEIHLLRQSLDLISISGKDAKFVANLQVKLEQEFMCWFKENHTDHSYEIWKRK